jgi:hypothetical protein
MNRGKFILSAAVIVLAVSMSGMALADGRHGRGARGGIPSAAPPIGSQTGGLQARRGSIGQFHGSRVAPSRDHHFGGAQKHDFRGGQRHDFRGRDHGHDGRHFHGHPFSRGVVIAAPLIVLPSYAYTAPPYPYYYPPVAAMPPQYIEQADQYRYYCPQLGAYFPDVQTCPGEWQPVPAQ